MLGHAGGIPGFSVHPILMDDWSIRPASWIGMGSPSSDAGVPELITLEPRHSGS